MTTTDDAGPDRFEQDLATRFRALADAAPRLRLDPAGAPAAPSDAGSAASTSMDHRVRPGRRSRGPWPWAAAAACLALAAGASAWWVRARTTTPAASGSCVAVGLAPALVLDGRRYANLGTVTRMPSGVQHQRVAMDPCADGGAQSTTVTTIPGLDAATAVTADGSLFLAPGAADAGLVRLLHSPVGCVPAVTSLRGIAGPRTSVRTTDARLTPRGYAWVRLSLTDHASAAPSSGFTDRLSAVEGSRVVLGLRCTAGATSSWVVTEIRRP